MLPKKCHTEWFLVIEDRDILREYMLHRFKMLVVMMFRFMQRNVIDACKDEKDDRKEREVRALAGKIIKGWENKFFDKIDAELEEFNKQKESSGFSEIVGTIVGSMINMKENIEERKKSIKEIGDAYLDALTIKEEKEDGTAKEEG